VTVFEKSDRIGGLLRYGIPNFKMEKDLIDRRVAQMSAEGVEFLTGQHVGSAVAIADLRRDYDALLLAMGAEAPRRLTVPGSHLKGIHYAMDYLTQQNRVCEGDEVAEQILATGKRVAIIGGGDTGADCLGTAHRQHAVSIHQLEYKEAPPEDRHPSTPWPMWPIQLRVESSHEEGGYREWSAMTLAFSGDDDGNVKHLHGIRVGPKPQQQHIPGTEFTLEVELVLMAGGFSGPVRGGVLADLGVVLNTRGTVAVNDDCMSSVPGVFAAGDAQRGQSLVVWAIADGRKAAEGIEKYLGL
jgi:glutamate synthase (NADPH/NADH) small chain